MKPFSIVVITALVTLVVVAVVIWFFVIPGFSHLLHLFETTSINRVEIENRILEAMIQDVVRQV